MASDSGPSSDRSPLATAIDARIASIDSAEYRRTNETVLRQFVSWLRRERGVEDLEEIDALDCRRWAQHLRERVDAGDLSASSAGEDGPYWTVVRACLGWCVRDERLDTNPAKTTKATEPLPEDTGERDTQFWSADQRDALLAHCDRQADRALDEEAGHSDPVKVFRDRALVVLLAYSGLRVAEVCRDRDDDRRNGLRWADLDLDRGIATVIGKTRQEEQAQVPTPAIDRLDRYRRVCSPPTDDWPVLPTFHAPTLSRRARDRLGDDVVDDALDSGEGIRSIVRAHEVGPPAITKNAARQVMQRLCEAADLDVDTYLKPHGGRRALGHQLYDKKAEIAQDALRHESVETTHDAYRDKQTVETRRRVDDILTGGDDDGS